MRHLQYPLRHPLLHHRLHHFVLRCLLSPSAFYLCPIRLRFRIPLHQSSHLNRCRRHDYFAPKQFPNKSEFQMHRSSQFDWIVANTSHIPGLSSGAAPASDPRHMSRE